MAWTLAQARIYLGLPVPPGPEDELIQRVLDETQVAVESALGRQLFLLRATDRFYNVNTDSLLLPRIPIKEVHAIDFQGVNPAGSAFGSGMDNLQIHKSVGWISSPEFYGQDQVNVDYEGGWETLPVPLEQAMWSAFLTRYDEHDTNGAPPRGGQGTTTISGSGEVSRVTIADLGTITYDVGSSSATAATDEDAIAKYGAWLATWAATWDFYRVGNAGGGLGLV